MNLLLGESDGVWYFFLILLLCGVPILILTLIFNILFKDSNTYKMFVSSLNKKLVYFLLLVILAFVIFTTLLLI